MNISIAEMVKAGMIPFVHASGGQVEIVGHEGLIYRNKAEAAAKISSVLTDPQYQASLRSHLAAQAEKFSSQRFKCGFKTFVKDWIENN